MELIPTRMNMRGFLLIQGLLVFSACADFSENAIQWTDDQVSRMADSAEVAALVAGYNEGEGYSLLIRDHDQKERGYLVTRLNGFPDVRDTLVRLDEHRFESVKNKTLFLVNDSEVVRTYYQKIIHPSSNWQGQAPWRETIASRHPRRDLDLRRNK